MLLKMKKFLSCASLLVTTSGFALETKPWLNNVYEFDFETAFSYAHFNKVQGASRQLTSPVNNRDLLLDFGFTPFPSFDIRVEGEFGKTNYVNWALRSGALQMRYQLMDDISGAPLSLLFGLNIRGATHHFLRDVSTPYAAEFNAEITCSAGKEWSDGISWQMRTYGYATLGQGNRGYPWTHELFVWEYNLYDTHRFGLFAEGDFGFGNKHHVDVKKFAGWGKYQHQSIDLGFSYGYKIGIWGILKATYAYRVFAHNYPEHVNFVSLSYSIPFSLF